MSRTNHSQGCFLCPPPWRERHPYATSQRPNIAISRTETPAIVN
jgi:hypothetical protein